MIIDSIDLQSDFDKYLDLASDEEIVITRNGLPIARLVPVSYFSDNLVGLLPPDADEKADKALTLDDLFSEYNDSCSCQETDTGSPTGNEDW